VLRIVVLTTLAMIAFAANSVLCRLALGAGAIDAATFSTIRLTSGAAMLLILARATGRRRADGLGGGWVSAVWLFLYAVPFSFAYLSLSAATGAIILFPAVQITMMIAALIAGERPGRVEWAGFALALGGLVYLILPGVTAPSPVGAFLMIIAGASWGVYSLRGRRSRDAIAATTENFVRSVPFVAVVSAVALSRFEATLGGVILAVASGALASGVGYVLWYAALPGLTATRASIVQLSVPIIAAAGGVVFLNERISFRLFLAAVMILGGVGLAVVSRTSRPNR
jgi:drug/metabolite transporter (DMT)-like permease